MVKAEKNSTDSSHSHPLHTTPIPKPKSKSNLNTSIKLQLRRGRPSLKSKRKHNTIILKADTHKIITDIDFSLSLQQAETLKTKGLSLVDESGNFVFYSKIASQHFEGSLNNLSRTNIFDLMIESSRNKVEEELSSSVSEAKLLKFTIYSKNSKRKYWKNTLNTNLSTKQLYYRYLKTILAKITPIQLNKVLDKSQFLKLFEDECWSVGDPAIVPQKLFLVQTRISSSMEEFGEGMMEDTVLSRFVENDNRKCGGTVGMEEDRDSQMDIKIMNA